MALLPVLLRLKITNYGLFPGTSVANGINWTFQPGLSVIAGINGLGKTTLLMMILRSFTGPYDLTGDGAPPAAMVTVAKSPVALRSPGIGFFAQRVADAANEATVELTASIGKRQLIISRSLHDLYLTNLIVDGHPVEFATQRHDRETAFQSLIAELMEMGSFIDVLFLLHHVVLFQEDRPGALWDINAQRHILRALFLEKHDASRVAELERSLNSADSQARNIHARITATENDLRASRRREAGSKGVIAQLEAEQKVLDAELYEAARLETVLADLDLARQKLRLEHERAKVEREETTGAVERLKYTALFRLFPTMDDAARLVVSRIMTQSHCLVCNAEAAEKRVELERLIEEGCCPSCGAHPEKQDNIIGAAEFEQAKLDQARERVELARREEETKGRELAQAVQAYDETVGHLAELRRTIDERRRKDRRLRAELPHSVTSSQYESALAALKSQHREWEGKRAVHLKSLRDLLNAKEAMITARSNELQQRFAQLTEVLLAEEARLAQVSTEPRYMQAHGPAAERLCVPVYAPEMTAADRPGFVRRHSPNDVSESQRELIDLAFRLALVKVATGDSGCTFIMETPEASLDGLAMARVGSALAKFCESGDNRLVVTTNLSNVGIVAALFGGVARSKAEADRRRTRVLNLLKLAAPNRALINDRSSYNTLLENAIYGRLP